MNWKPTDEGTLESECGRFEIERDGAKWMLCDGNKPEVLDLDAEGNCKWFESLESAKLAAEYEVSSPTSGWLCRWVAVILAARRSLEG